MRPSAAMTRADSTRHTASIDRDRVLGAAWTVHLGVQRQPWPAARRNSSGKSDISKTCRISITGAGPL